VITKALTAAIAAILVVSNITIINAQQLTSQSGEIDNGIITATSTTFQSTSDGFTVQVPDGWIIQDTNNTGLRLEDEIRLGYGILAQLCNKEQQGSILSNASDTINSISTVNTNGCQGAQEIIHIVRYPDLDTRVVSNNITANNLTTDNILLYHLQKLQEVGYRGIQIVNRSDVTLNLTNPQTSQTTATVPAKLVEMTYNTASAPDEMRRGYLLSTASNQTAPNFGTTKGYTVFYEGNIITNAVTSETTTATTSDSLALTLLSPAVAQVFDSFELIVAPELALAEETPQAVETTEGGGEGEDDDGDDNGGEDDDGDDNEGEDDDGDEGDNDDGQGLAQRIIEETEERVSRIIGR